MKFEYELPKDIEATLNDAMRRFMHAAKQAEEIHHSEKPCLQEYVNNLWNAIFAAKDALSAVSPMTDNGYPGSVHENN